MSELATLIQVALACVALWVIITPWIRREELSVRQLMRRDFICAAVWGTLAISDYFSKDPRLWIVGGEVALTLLYVYFSTTYDEEDFDE